MESVTVAFQLAALERLADPNAVFEQTTGWASHVGILSDRPTHVITEFANDHHLDIGFHSGPRSLLESLPHARAQPELAAERYLLIGTDEVDREAVRDAGWAVLTVEEAAEAAGWELRRDDEDDEPTWV